ncbi:unknown [Alistipes sp. CAG:268]|nr:unknown [Alistipes sp. CAG:268]
MGFVGLALLLGHEVPDVCGPEGPVVAGLIGLDQFERLPSAGPELPELREPRAQLPEQRLVAASGLHLCRHLLDGEELAQQGVVLLLRVLRDAEGAGLPRLGAAVSGLRVAGVDGKGAVGVGRLGREGLDAALPVVDRVEVGGIPRVVGHAVEGQLRGLAVLHRVAHHAADLSGRERLVEPVYGTLQDDVAGVVRHGEVPPVEGRAADARIDPLHCLAGHVAAHDVTRPEDVHRRVERLAVDAQAALRRGVGPQARVVGRADRQRGDVALGAHELLVEAVEELGLLHGIGPLARDVVEEDGERADAEVVHHLELADQVVVVLLVPLDVLSGVDGPHEVHAVAVAGLDQFADLPRLLLGIGQAPVRAAVVGVVLRTIEVAVHLVAAVEIDERETHLMRPGGSVETLHDAAQRQVGIVRDRDEGQLPPGGRGALDQLAERLDAVEGAAFVVSRDPDPLLPDLQGVGSRAGFDAAFGSLPGPEVDLEHRTLLRRGEEAEVVGEPAPEILDAEALRQVERSGTVCC